jgi:hypothetical protein
MPSIVTANDLRSGAVVYLASGGIWVERIDEAAIATDDASLKRLEDIALRAVENCKVTAVYAMDVSIAESRPVPVSVRERIRAARGPSV